MSAISLVYLYVNASDPNWMASYLNHTQNLNHERHDTDHETIYYSLKSVNHYMPWLKSIYVVVDDIQVDVVAHRLKEFDNVVIIPHSTIAPKQCLPLFNSIALEDHIIKIPGLEEHFVYANDDMFVVDYLYPEDFFSPLGDPSIQFVGNEMKPASFLSRFRSDKYAWFVDGTYQLLKARSIKAYVSSHMMTPMTQTLVRQIQTDFPIVNCCKTRYACGNHYVALNPIAYPSYLKASSTYMGFRKLNMYAYFGGWFSRFFNLKINPDAHMLCINGIHVHDFTQNSYEFNTQLLRI